MNDLTADQIHEEVKTRYGRLADEFKIDVAASCSSPGEAASCCDTDEDALFSNLYNADTSWLPEDVTGLSLGCGDPITLAGLKPGLTVLDLGSGAGIDCFMAARQVGPSGQVIGVDMTLSMLEKANRNKEKVGLDNVEFRQGQIEDMPVDSDSVDVILSNCVINLSPDKTAVFQEAYRVLKPGGRLAVSDVVTLGKFTPEQRADMVAWTGCITGAEDVADYVGFMKAAGFTGISVRDKNNPDAELADSLAQNGELKVLSARVTAVKPHDGGKDEFVVTQPDILDAKLSKEQVPEVYTAKARFYDVWGRFTESKAQVRSLELANIQDGETILEVAVGTGLTFARVLEQNPSGWNEGLDLTEAMLAKAKEKAAQSGVTNYHLQIGDAYELPFENGRFDLLINNYMFDLLPKADFPQVLAEFHRVLKPDGRLLLVNMAKGRRWYNRVWEKLYQRNETSMAGCRSVSMAAPLEANGFTVTNHEYVSQMTFPSEILIAIKV